MGSAPQRGTTQNFWVLLFCHDRLDSIWGVEPIQNAFRPWEGHNPEFGNIYAFFFCKMSRFMHFFLGSAQTVKITGSSTIKFFFHPWVTQWKIEFNPKSDPLPQTVTQRMSPLRVAKWKIEFSPKSEPSYQRFGVANEPPCGSTLKNCSSIQCAPMTQRMSPLRVEQWKIEIPLFRGPVPQRWPNEWSPLGSHNEKLKYPTFMGRCPKRWPNEWAPLE